MAKPRCRRRYPRRFSPARRRCARSDCAAPPCLCHAVNTGLAAAARHSLSRPRLAIAAPRTALPACLGKSAAYGVAKAPRKHRGPGSWNPAQQAPLPRGLRVASPRPAGSPGSRSDSPRGAEAAGPGGATGCCGAAEALRVRPLILARICASRWSAAASGGSMPFALRSPRMISADSASRCIETETSAARQFDPVLDQQSARPRNVQRSKLPRPDSAGVRAVPLGPQHGHPGIGFKD